MKQDIKEEEFQLNMEKEKVKKKVICMDITHTYPVTI